MELLGDNGHIQSVNLFAVGRERLKSNFLDDAVTYF